VANNSSNDLLYTVSDDGGSSWSASQQVGGSSSPQSSSMAPSITSSYVDGLSMAYVANNSDNDLLFAFGNPDTNDGCTTESWSSSTRVGTQSSKTAPTMTSFVTAPNSAFEEDLVMAYVANNSTNDLVVTTDINDSVPPDWSAPTLVGNARPQSSKFAPTLTEWDPGFNSSVIQETMAYVANNGSNDLILTSSTNGDATDWSGDVAISGKASQTAPALPNLSLASPILMAYVANNRKSHLLMTTSENGGVSWSSSTKIKSGPGAESSRIRR